MLRIRTQISKTTVVISIILLVVIFYGLSVREHGRMPWHQQVIVGTLTPFQKSVQFIGGGIRGLWNHYFALVDAARENDLLKKKVLEQAYLLRSMAEIESENERLRHLLNFAEGHSLQTIGAKVVGNDPRSDFRVITIDKGTSDGLSVNMPVVSGAGLVGRIGDVGGDVSMALLITDPNSAVDVFVQRSRARALLAGETVQTKLGRSYYLSRLEYLDRKSDILNGDVLVTSGLDGIFPSGIPVGVVADIKQSQHDVFKEAIVIPFVDFGNLEEVLVLKK